jgi:hypothetical protein
LYTQFSHLLCSQYKSAFCAHILYTYCDQKLICYLITHFLYTCWVHSIRPIFQLTHSLHLLCSQCNTAFCVHTVSIHAVYSVYDRYLRTQCAYTSCDHSIIRYLNKQIHYSNTFYSIRPLFEYPQSLYLLC